MTKGLRKLAEALRAQVETDSRRKDEKCAHVLRATLGLNILKRKVGA